MAPLRVLAAGPAFAAFAALAVFAILVVFVVLEVPGGFASSAVLTRSAGGVEVSAYETPLMAARPRTVAPAVTASLLP